MKPYKTLILENEPVVLKQLLVYLQTEPYNSVISIARTLTTCSETIDTLITESFQLSILDIELDDGTCFDVLNKVSRSNFGEIVFATSYGGSYVENLVDAKPIHYLSKPFSKEKIQTMLIAVEKALISKLDPPQYVELFKNHTGTRIFVHKKDILYVEYKDYKLIFHFLEGGKYTTAIHNQSLAKQLEHLGDKFVQCSKNCIINVDFLKEYDPNEKEGLIILMPNNAKIEISRKFKDAVLARKGVL